MRGEHSLIAALLLAAFTAAGCFKIDHGGAVVFTGPTVPPPPPPPTGQFPPIPPAPPPFVPAPPPAPPPPGPTSWAISFMPDKEAVTDVVSHPDEPPVVFALTGVSLYRTLDTGAVWTRVATNLAPSGGALAAIAVTRSSVFLGVSRDAFGFAGNVARSTNDGSSFAIVTTLTVAFTHLGVSGVSTETLFATSFATAATPAQVFRSDDAAASWTSVLSLVPGTQSPDLAVAATDSRVALAAVGNQGGVAFTQDGGVSWSTALAGVAVTCVAISPTSSSTYFAGASNKEVHRSLDGGTTWTKITTIFTPRRLRVAPSDAQVLYSATASDGAFSSPSGGGSWFPANLGISSLSLSAIGVNAADPLVVFATEGVRVYKTTNGGK